MTNLIERKQNLLIRLRELGLSRVEISYSGSGDSGQVDEICGYLPNTRGAQSVNALEAKHAAPNSVVVRVTNVLLNEENETLERKLTKFAIDAIEASNLSDWYNNDGGGGTMTILVEEGCDSEGDSHEAGTVSIHHYYNMVNQEYESATL